MLFSPARIHASLSNVTSSTDVALPHTAMLITPAGQIMSFVSTPPGYDYYEGQETNGDGGNKQGEEEEEEPEGGEGDEEPWLDTPERLRLILGLVSEFTEGTVNKIESELGKLLVSPIETESPSHATDAILPSVRPPASSSFLLILNGSSKSDWAVLSTKANEFKETWANGR